VKRVKHGSGVYRQRVARLGTVRNDLGFQLVPWRPALEQQLGRQVSGVISPNGAVDWSLERKRGLGI
jgi:hypothetical protein